MFTKLDSLRGIAACMIVLYHSPLSYSEHPVSFITNSYLFVDLFFLLSGFVVSYAYADRIKNGLSLKTYFVLRLGRVYPLHLFMLIVFVLYTIFKAYLYSRGIGGEQSFENNNVYSVITNFFLIHSIGVHDYLTWNYPSWSISVEFFTYIIFFLLLVSVDRDETIIIPLAISFIGYFVLLFIIGADLQVTYNFGLIRCVSAFYLGVLLLRIRRTINASYLKMNVLEVSSFSLMVVAICLAHKSWHFQMLAIASFFCVIYVNTSSQSGILGCVFNSSLIRTIGKWSYSIYMTHALIISFTRSFSEYVLGVELSEVQGFVSIVLNCALLFFTVLISRYTYIYVEELFRNMVKHKIQASS
ncbi:MAG: acyltransferase [Acidiferrobacterales bacterium]|nr:acyltransferase [Acidiferrobacterales bacterium]